MNTPKENITVKNKIIDIIAALFSKSGIDTDIFEFVDFIDDLGMDSVAFVSLVIDFETVFNITIPDDLLLLENFRNYEKTLSTLSKSLQDSK